MLFYCLDIKIVNYKKKKKKIVYNPEIVLKLLFSYKMRVNSTVNTNYYILIRFAININFNCFRND